MAQLVARSTVSRCVVGSSPRRAEHFGFPPNAPRALGSVWSWYVKALVCTAVSMRRLGIDKIPCHLSKREGDCLPVVGFLLISFIN